MGFFSFFGKNKQKPVSEQSAYHSRAEEDSGALRANRKRKTSNNQSNDPEDPVLPEKKRARRRLVGAVALVLAVVIVLPMVLDSEPKPLPSDIAIQIPSREKPAEKPGEKPASTVAPASASSFASDSPHAISGLNKSGLDKQEEIIDPASTGEPNLSSPSDVVKNTASNATMPVENGVVAPPPEAVIAAEAKADPKTTAKAKVETKPKVAIKEERKPRPEPKSEVSAEDRPSVNDSEGDSARAAAILNGRTDSAAPAAEKKSGKFVIQIAALASQEKVDELQGKLTGAGIRSYTQKIKTSLGDRIRIRVGPFANKEDAEKARTKLAPLGLSGSLVPA
ncbi:SPOR domain-containing protein [Glaciimonas immobilis]|uniref:DedD protein n=1 Tax=Glaciimonas immobilis TaxID=728004 RepID=A0A840RYF1_9BURK|nr:SPOR domain-containing protein [Glaciimonas immobilis]KAF3998280.1 hypothetical protein HAV38_08720 [Glaciimonas immobilis]MBB5201896.1 DedD protein [Glaciimonas immobilis]